MQNLAKNCKIQRVKVAQAAGTSDITSDAVDMQGFEACMFIVEFGAIVSGAVTSVKAQQSSDNGSSDTYADLTGTSVTVADTDDNKVAYLDVVRPKERYLKCIVDRGTQNATVDSMLAILYNPRVKPPTHDSSTVLGGEVHVSPAEGTA